MSTSVAKETAGSYIPDSMVIKLGKALDAFADPLTPKGFEKPETFGIFFHEWIHYLHNVSTIVGISALQNLIKLWQIFRFSFEPGGFSAGSDPLPSDAAVMVTELQKYLGGSRKRHFSTLDKLTSLNNVTVTDIVLEPQGTAISTLRCTIHVLEQDGHDQVHTAHIGTNEILENVAWLLEKKLVNALGGASNLSLPTVTPYRIVEAAASLKVPEQDDDVIIACMLSALQDSDPPSVLLDRFEIVKDALEKQVSPIAELAKMTKLQLANNETWMENCLCGIEASFPVDEPMARAVRDLVATVRRNMQFRRDDPFFEFSIIEKLRANSATFDDEIRRYGACAVIQERSGYEDDIQRDLMYCFTDRTEDETDPQVGWRIIHAAFRFLGLHTSVTGFMPTINIKAIACPFYTICDLSLRKAEPEICRTSPWISVDWATWEPKGDRCWYGTAIYVTRPPSI